MILLNGLSLAAWLLACSITAAHGDHRHALERDTFVRVVRDNVVTTSATSTSTPAPTFTQVDGSNGDTWCDPKESTQCDDSDCSGMILPSPFPTPGPACLAVGAQMFCACTPSNNTSNFCPNATQIACDSDCAPNNNVCSQKWANCQCGGSNSSTTSTTA